MKESVDQVMHMMERYQSINQRPMRHFDVFMASILKEVVPDTKIKEFKVMRTAITTRYK